MVLINGAVESMKYGKVSVYSFLSWDLFNVDVKGVVRESKWLNRNKYKNNKGGLR
jgi:hypothetical protein